MSRIDEIRERERRASKGPWEAVGDRVFLTEAPIISGGNEEETEFDCCSATYSQGCNNALFIANAREDIPFLLGEVERLQQRLDAAEGVVEAFVIYSHYKDNEPLADIKTVSTACENLTEALKTWRKLKEQL